MARGNQGQPIFRDDQDRGRFLETLGETCEKTGWQIHAYVEPVAKVAVFKFRLAVG